MSTLRNWWLLSIGIMAASAPALAATTGTDTPRPPAILMVTSMDPPLMKLDERQVALLDDTPFQGVAISMMGIYDGGPLPDEAALQARCAHLKRISKKVIWPRVYLNRMIGFLPKVSRRAACAHPEYFDRIRGFDLWDDAGARSDFLRLWRLSLRAARTLGAPGVVLDFESYNCGGLGNPATLAAATGRSLPETQAALRHLGAMLADVAAEEYPGAVLWSLFTGLGRTPYRVDGRSVPMLHASLFEGLLQQAAERAYSLVLVCGGETDLGYYNASPEALGEKIRTREAALRPWLGRFPGKLTLGGTITLWNDDTKLTGWARESAGASPPFKRFGDFAPMLAALFSAYRYVWIYVPMVTDYRPFDPDTAPALNAELRKTLSKASPAAP